MPFYQEINQKSEEGRRTADRLLALKNALREELPHRTIGRTLLLATWNLREFGDSKTGVRGNEPLHYIAEIIDHFDLVALQEVRENTDPLDRLLRYLGNWWKVMMTGVTQGVSGNTERMAFLYDSRKITFDRLAGQVVLPPRRGRKMPAIDQFARTPYVIGFRAGWFRFAICTAHIYYGTAKKDDPRRIAEIQELASFLAARREDKHPLAKNMILLGDFNIFSTGDATFQAIRDAGFTVPEQLMRLPSNARRNKHYDQIAFKAPAVRNLRLCAAGVFDFFKHVYRAEDEATYAPERPPRPSYKQWRTFQMSDHFPMWIELQIDFSESYLRSKKRIPKPDAGTVEPI